MNHPTKSTLQYLAAAAIFWLTPIAAVAQLGLPSYDFWTYLEDGEPRLGTAVAVGDFDGDGFGDMAVGAEWADAGVYHSGRVQLRRTSNQGIVSSEALEFCLDPSDRGQSFHLGASLAFGDFDGDGDEDLAVGIPRAEVAGVLDAGAVCIIEGGAGPLVAAPRVKFSQEVLTGTPEQYDAFGSVLVAGDLNGDPYADLAIGVPGDTVQELGPPQDNAGAVHVLLGGPNGLTAASEIYVSRLSDPWWEAWDGEGFGSALVIGDYAQQDGTPPDGIGDLAVGSAGDNIAGIGGSVTIFHGDAVTPVSVADYPMHDGGPWDLLGTASPGEGFGSSLAAGDYDGDGLTDLAVGIPLESDLTPEVNAGAVMVLYGGAQGLSDEGEDLLLESTVLGAAAVDDHDRFGEVLVSGDFDLDGRSDLAIGIPGDDPLNQTNAGKAMIVYGSPTGITFAGFQLIAMNFFEDLAPFDDFAYSLAAGKLFDLHGGDDLLIGAPGHVAPDSGGFPQPDTGAAVVVQSVIMHTDGFESGDLSAWTVVQ